MRFREKLCKGKVSLTGGEKIWGMPEYKFGYKKIDLLNYCIVK